MGNGHKNGKRWEIIVKLNHDIFRRKGGLQLGTIYWNELYTQHRFNDFILSVQIII